MSYPEDAIRELYEYRPPLTKREDFDLFWQETLRQTKAVALRPAMEEYDYPSGSVKVYDISYNGFDETRIHGWYIVPEFLKREKYPCVINYHGYSGSRGEPADFMAWAMMGLAVLSVDCRDQGGITGNCARYSSGIIENVTNKGILDKYEYYYRAVYMDCIKAIDFAESCEKVDKDRIVLHGISQGGALGMAVSCLDRRPKLTLVDVPSNSNLERRVEGPYGSFRGVAEYLKKYPEHLEKAYETLSYFDTMNMADKIRCRVFAAVGLKDETCPAVCYFASYNRISAPKQICIYPFNGHEGAKIHMERKMRCLRENGIVD